MLFHQCWTALACLLALAELGVAAADAARPPNIVFILVDDMGWTDLGCFGSELYETPHIDRLAAKGMRFTCAYSACTVCSPSRAAVVTGRYPARLHLTDWIHGHRRPKAKLRVPAWTEYLPAEEVTLAAALKKAGYVSAAIGKWHLGDGPEHYATQHGFDLNIAGFGAGQPPSYFSPYKIPTLADGPPGEYLTDRETDEACRFMEEHRDRPFLLYMPRYCVHTPLQAKPPLIERYRQKITPGMRQTNATYAAMIHSLDESVGRLLAKLDELNLADHTVVCFTSDNGGLIGGEKRRVTSNAPLRAGKGSAYEGGVRVPLMIHWPGVTTPGSACGEPVIGIDYFPTFLEMAGLAVAPDDGHALDGVSLAPLLKDAHAALGREAIFWHYPHYHPGGATPYSAIRAGDYRLVEFYEDQHVELYNLRTDVGEAHDLAATQPERAAGLRRRLAAWRAEVGAQDPTPNPDFQP
ncbi:MAG TPA: sulfatase [Pirellulales bacterium]